jgi:hypothetical protein
MNCEMFVEIEHLLLRQKIGSRPVVATAVPITARTGTTIAKSSAGLFEGRFYDAPNTACIL